MAIGRRLPWSRLAAEFVVIVVGVLVALAVDQWMANAEDRELELEYAGRLRTALSADTARFSGFERPVATKVELLRRLLAQDPSLVSSDPAELIDELRVSIYVAIPESRSEVFREMESSGTVALLGDVELRDGLAAYYARHAFLSGILQQSYGDYRNLVTGTVDPSSWYSYLVGSADEVDQRRLRASVEALLRDPRFPSAAGSELAYAASMTQYVRELRADAEELLQRLDDAYPP